MVVLEISVGVVLLVLMYLMGPAVFFEVAWDVVKLLWIVVTWPFVMTGLGIGLGMMWLLVKLGLWQMPNPPYDLNGHLRFPWSN